MRKKGRLKSYLIVCVEMGGGGNKKASQNSVKEKKKNYLLRIFKKPNRNT